MIFLQVILALFEIHGNNKDLESESGRYNCLWLTGSVVCGQMELERMGTTHEIADAVETETAMAGAQERVLACAFLFGGDRI